MDARCWDAGCRRLVVRVLSPPHGFTANVSPDAWLLLNDKLYLFSDENVKKEWAQHAEENMKICDENWRMTGN